MVVDSFRFQQISSKLHAAQGQTSGPLASPEYRTLVSAVKELAELCAEQAREIQDLKRKVDQGPRVM